ncbi:uncharacterized protein [Anoplolepis gracilipes]|uniref:uncharacterized protein n=1 Tax=Anoplolepis gracilipes TaxID=354296 RepID=UPI003BA0E806
MVDELRYELNGVEIDRNRNVGIICTIKNYISLTHKTSKILHNAAWNIVANNGEGYINFCVPLNLLLGFCEAYKRVVINARHELILIRSRNDNNCLFGAQAAEAEIELHKIQWRMPHVILNEISKLSLLRALESGKYLNMSFRLWELYEFPLLHSTTKHSWTVKTASQLKKPRYRYVILFDMYASFRKSYYGCNNDNVLFTMAKFLECGPLTVIDCSRQNESVKNATVDVRIEFECKLDVPANITAYCLILYDHIVECNPLTNVVCKIT